LFTPNCFVQKTASVVYLFFMHTVSVVLLALGAGLTTNELNAADQQAGFPSGMVTNVGQLQHLNFQKLNADYSIRLDGTVWWVNPAQNKLVLHDASGTAELEADLHGQPVQFGQRVLLEGNGTIIHRGAGFRIGVREPSWQVKIAGQGTLPDFRWIAIGQTLNENEDDPWAQVEGEVTMVSEQPDGWHLELSAMGGSMRAEIGNATGLSSALLLNHRIRATGFCQDAFTTSGQKVPGVLLVPSGKEIEFIEASPGDNVSAGASTNAGTLPVLTNAITINQMKREEAERGYPARIQGVVVCVVSNRPAFIVQDATRAVYVVVDSAIIPELPQIGSYVEVGGKTDKGSFAPIVRAQQINMLGLGNLPEPTRPSWDQLMNGSLDDQWVELKGIIVSMTNRPINWTAIRLRTQDGTLPVDFRVMGMSDQVLERYKNALVRIRGCLFVLRDVQTDQVRLGGIRMFANDITMDEPAPVDLFSVPKKSAAELTLFDSQASAFQRVKVSGQIVHVRGTENFLMDGTNGLRFVTQQPLRLQAGDLVEVVGFPELGGPAPVLSEAEARKTGHAVLPVPKNLPLNDLVRAVNDSTLVRVDALLAGVRDTETNEVLEMQAGSWRFLARLNEGSHSTKPLRIGSKLELTGVYCAQGGYKNPGEDIAAVDLLLNSPADIRVLTQPSWWTLQRLFVAISLLGCVLAGMLIWITQLHRQVEKRTVELEVQIQQRQRVEHQRAMEQERARIARDLHDELGSSITEISMLAARTQSTSALEENRSRYLKQMSGKASEMVVALDEIVWAMNPTHDSIASLVSYFCLYADRFLGLANIRWQIEDHTGASDLVVNSRHRHQLFLAFKEALNNVVRHSGATEVHLKIQIEQGELQLVIADNGRGLPLNSHDEAMDGLANMRERAQKLGGRFEVASGAGRGTTLQFYLPAK
jgi:signal transduction histidine kinase